MPDASAVQFVIHRADGLPLPAQFRQGQRIARPWWTRCGAKQARRAAACRGYRL